MARLHGKGGSVTFANGYVVNCHSWTVDRTGETVDGTVFGATNRVADAGLKNATGSFVCYVDSDAALKDVHVAGEAVFLMGPGKTLTAKILITDFSVNVGLDGNETVTYRFVLSGDGTATDFVIA